jgi:hypothetical protein
VNVFAALHESGCGTSRTSGDVRLESAKWGKADIDQVARRFRREQSPQSPASQADHTTIVLALMLAAPAKAEGPLPQPKIGATLPARI